MRRDGVCASLWWSICAIVVVCVRHRDEVVFCPEIGKKWCENLDFGLFVLYLCISFGHLGFFI